MLTETFHSFRLVPTDGRPHRADVPPSYRGVYGDDAEGLDEARRLLRGLKADS